MQKQTLYTRDNTIYVNNHPVGYLDNGPHLNTWLSYETQSLIEHTFKKKPTIKMSQKPSHNPTPIPGIKHIIAVAAGKGGVGKSTIAVQLARHLAKSGANIGILDADIYGPSLNVFFPFSKAIVTDHKWQPHLHEGIQLMSLAYVVSNTDAMAWRGPMAGKALLQLALNTLWQELDFLIIDLPPGTGDVTLTMAQKLPINAALMVTQSHELAHADLIRAHTMFQKVSIPTLGFINNLSHITCPHCQKNIAPFQALTLPPELYQLGSYPWSEKAQRGYLDTMFYNLADQVMIAYDTIKPLKSRRIQIPIKVGDRDDN